MEETTRYNKYTMEQIKEVLEKMPEPYLFHRKNAIAFICNKLKYKTCDKNDRFLSYVFGLWAKMLDDSLDERINEMGFIKPNDDFYSKNIGKKVDYLEYAGSTNELIEFARVYHDDEKGYGLLHFGCSKKCFYPEYVRERKGKNKTTKQCFNKTY